MQKKKPATLREVIGGQVKAFREGRAWTQDDLGAALQELTGKTWSRQAISRLEKGRRAFDAAEILILAKVLGGGISAFQLLAAPNVETVVLSDTVSLPMSEVLDLLLPPISTGERGSRGDKKVLDMLATATARLRDLAESERALADERERITSNAQQLLGYLAAPYALEEPPKG